VKKVIRKYFLTSLALMLILSNFSFATTYMLCNMGGEKSSCCCNHSNTKHIAGLSISKIKSSCCNEGTIELSNSNLLSTVKTEQPQDNLGFNSILIDNNSTQLFSANYNFKLVSIKNHVPKRDIPILISSLLI
jgi:hypothetical protein